MWYWPENTEIFSNIILKKHYTLLKIVQMICISLHILPMSVASNIVPSVPSAEVQSSGCFSCGGCECDKTRRCADYILEIKITDSHPTLAAAAGGSMCSNLHSIYVRLCNARRDGGNANFVGVTFQKCLWVVKRFWNTVITTFWYVRTEMSM